MADEDTLKTIYKKMLFNNQNSNKYMLNKSDIGLALKNQKWLRYGCFKCIGATVAGIFETAAGL